MYNLKEKWKNTPLPIKASAAYAICSILQNGLSFMTLPLFTRILTQEQYGQYTVYSSWSGILSIFITLNLAYGSFSAAMIKFEDRRDEYISSIQGVCLVLSLVFLIIYLPFCKIWNRWLELPTFLVCVMVAEITCSTSIQLWNGKKRFEFKYKSVVVLTIISSVVAPIVAAVMVFHTDEKGYARIVGYALVTILTGGVIFLLNLLRGKKLISKKIWKYAFQFNIPLLAYYLSQVIFNQSDRIMISHMCGIDKAAVYGVAYNFAMFLGFVLNAINNSYVPWFYGKMKSGDAKDNRKISIEIAVFFGALLLAIIWFAPEIIIIFAGKKYASALYIVAPVAMSLFLLFYSQLFINVEFYFEEKEMLVWASIGGAVLNIVLNYILIPIFGFVVAGYTTLASYIVFSASNYFAMRKVLMNRNIPNDMFDYKTLILLLSLFMIAGVLGVALYSWVLPRIIISIFVFFTMIAYWKKICRHFESV